MIRGGVKHLISQYIDLCFKKPKCVLFKNLLQHLLHNINIQLWKGYRDKVRNVRNVKLQIKLYIILQSRTEK